MWIVFSMLAAFFAAVTSVLVKIGVEGVNTNLATAIRTAVVMVMAWGIVFAFGLQGGLENVTRRNWAFLALSGVATGLSWLFYNAALQKGEVSRVAPVDKSSVVLAMVLAFLVLREKITPGALVGGGLITAGTFVMIFWK